MVSCEQLLGSRIDAMQLTTKIVCIHTICQRAKKSRLFSKKIPGAYTGQGNTNSAKNDYKKKNQKVKKTHP